jgi:hypothetical protein
VWHLVHLQFDQLAFGPDFHFCLGLGLGLESFRDLALESLCRLVQEGV